jgi:DNA-binding LytR/AlgR family response regulator
MIHTHAAKYVTAMNVGTMLKKLPEERFARVSKSYVINVDCIDQVDIDTIQLGPFEIPLGRSYKESFIDRYIKGKLMKR